MSRREDERPEPVTITDKRRIDPQTGAVRGVASAPEAARSRSDTHDAEPTVAQEAEVLEAEVLEAEVLEVGATEVGATEAGATEAGATDEPGGVTELDPVRAELAERTGDLQRVSAEYANYRRRVDRDRQAVIEAAKASVAAELLGVLDDLERARSHGDLDGPLRSVADKLAAALTNQGLTDFGAVGDAFDPAVHEAVSHSGDGGAPVVSMVMRHGYRFGERVLRPAMVAVEESPPVESSEEPGAGTDQPVPGPDQL